MINYSCLTYYLYLSNEEDENIKKLIRFEIDNKIYPIRPISCGLGHYEAIYSIEDKDKIEKYIKEINPTMWNIAGDEIDE